MSAAGILAGANTASGAVDSYPGTDAATVGKPGTSAEGSSVVTASARSLPADHIVECEAYPFVIDLHDIDPRTRLEQLARNMRWRAYHTRRVVDLAGSRFCQRD